MEEQNQIPPTMVTKDQKLELTCNAKETNLIKVMDFTSAKAISENMSNFYEGDTKVKKDKLQGYRMQFEPLIMHDDQDISKYFLRVNEVVNTIRGLDEKLDEDIVVQKVLRYLVNPQL